METKEKEQIYLIAKKEFEKGSKLYFDTQKIKLKQELCNLMDNPYYKFDEGVRVWTYLNGVFMDATHPIKTTNLLKQIQHFCERCENIKELQELKAVSEFFHDQKNFKYPLDMDEILELPYWKHECEHKYLHQDVIKQHIKWVQTWIHAVISSLNAHFKERFIPRTTKEYLFHEGNLFWRIIKNLKYTKKEKT